MNNSVLKKSLLGACLLVALFSLGCKKDAGPFLRGRQQKEIDNLKAEIQKMAGSLSCENSADWKFVTLKEGPCMEPLYIAYSTKGNEASILEKTELHNKKQREFNARYNKEIMCTLIGYMPPSRVECVDGKPKFVR